MTNFQYLVGIKILTMLCGFVIFCMGYKLRLKAMDKEGDVAASIGSYVNMSFKEVYTGTIVMAFGALLIVYGANKPISSEVNRHANGDYFERTVSAAARAVKPEQAVKKQVKK